MTNSSNNSNGFTITRVCGTTGKVLGTSTMPYPTFVKKGRRDNAQVAWDCDNCKRVHSSLSNADDCCKVAKLQAKADALQAKADALQAKADALQANIDGLKADRDALAALIDAVS
jgi:peptidoglycan hydrolase CwlO-like protein